MCELRRHGSSRLSDFESGASMSAGLIWLLLVALILLCSVPWMVRDFRRAPKLPPEKWLRRPRLLWEPRDMWVGVYREPATRRTYICFVPCIVLLLEPTQAAKDAMDQSPSRGRSGVPNGS